MEDLGEYLKTPGPTIRAALLVGIYAPQPGRRTALPKAGGGTRNLGIPTGLDRVIEPALWQVLQETWDPTFSESSDGVRPQRSAHQAVGQGQGDLREGYTWVVDIDLEQCCDRVNHDGLLSRVRRRVKDRRVVTWIHRFRNAGVLTLAGSVEPTVAGPPKGNRAHPCGRTGGGMRSTRNWKRAGTGSPATATRRTSTCGVGRRGHG